MKFSVSVDLANNTVSRDVWGEITDAAVKVAFVRWAVGSLDRLTGEMDLYSFPFRDQHIPAMQAGQANCSGGEAHDLKGH
jgi:hypothetical protein